MKGLLLCPRRDDQIGDLRRQETSQAASKVIAEDNMPASSAICVGLQGSPKLLTRKT